jgi:hypothetical protein
MSQTYDLIEINERGLQDKSTLNATEMALFILLEFDLLMEMEGWDHFFLYQHHFDGYEPMKSWLRKIGDEESLGFLADYESHLAQRGVSLVPRAIELFLNAQDDAYLNACPDWREQYVVLGERRWDKTSSYLERQGIALAI